MLLNFKFLNFYIENYKILRFQYFVTKDLKLVEIDSDIKAEYISQKKYLEKSVNMLKKNLIKVEFYII